MIRNLKVLLAAAMAVAAVSTVGAGSAQAAEFHCSVEPCTLTLQPDGTGKTTHHVFSFTIGGVTTSVTCNQITGTATSSKTTTNAISVTNLSYGTELNSCNVAGQHATIDMNSCFYEFTSDAAGTVHVRCPGATKSITVTFGTCTVHIPEQTVTGIVYTNLGGKTEVTAATGGVKNITGEATSGCPAVGHFINGEYTTGNTIVTGETDPGGVMANVWYE